MLHILKYQQLSRLGFPAQGDGIARRSRRYATEWRTHLENSRCCQRDWAAGFQADKLLLLGAGRLHDVAITELLSCCTCLSLFDADPKSARAWRKALGTDLAKHSRLESTIDDCTGVLARWNRDLAHCFRQLRLERGDFSMRMSRFLPRWDEYQSTQGLNSSLPRSQFLLLQPFDAVCSLNLLSQIPLRLMVLIERQLHRFFPAASIKQHEQCWLEIYRALGSRLVEQHLRDLNQSSASHILLVTDTEYLHYQFETPAAIEQTAEGPFYFDATSDEWKAVPSHANRNVRLERISALCGIDLFARTHDYFQNFQLMELREWLWNIVPYAAERPAAGSIHRVQVLRLQR